MRVSKSTVHMMHDRLTGGIGFKRKRFSTEPMPLHLFDVKLLHVLYAGIQLCINVLLCPTVHWEKVNEPHHFSLLQRL